VLNIIKHEFFLNVIPWRHPANGIKLMYVMQANCACAIERA